jgi:RNA polymerase sigma-70 factor (ECF subfamily)
VRITGRSDNPEDRFHRLAWPQVPTLLRTAGYLTRDTHAAEDLVQETMIRAMKNMASFEEGTDIRAWLMTIMRRTHIDLYRADRKHRDVVSLDAAEGLRITLPDEREAGAYDDRWDNPEEILERFADDVVVLALKTLPEEIRWTLLLVDVEQLDHADAASVLGVPVGTIKSRAHRGRAMLRDRLHQHAASIGVADRRQEVEP